MGRPRDIDVWREQLAQARERQQREISLLRRVDALPRPVVRKPVLTLVRPTKLDR